MTRLNALSVGRCADRFCDPSKGNDGCQAFIANLDNFDGDDPWVNSPLWANCPVAAAEKAHERRNTCTHGEWDGEFCAECNPTYREVSG